VDYSAKDKLVVVDPLTENALNLTNQLIDKSTKDLTFIVQYPQLEGWSNMAVQTKLNDFFKAEATGYVTAGQELLQLSTTDWNTDEIPLRFDYDTNYTITYNQENKLSMYFEPYQYTGGAHGTFGYQAHTFDLTTGEELSLKQVTNNPNYQTIINAAILQQIKERKIVLLYPFESIREDQGFFLREDSLVVYFSLYEYTPYVAGMPEFSIPLSDFK
ncbi:MAG: DUF3298 and DUF4163 domain-containing protein, partial [Gorillibacterium sp.]|nr:DUF3298 and DUF4163 domain-containing protein [Gorillibacterium sp.]